MADGPLVVILAAGQGTRMRSAVPKVLHRLGGKPLVLHAVDTGAVVAGGPPVVVVSPEQPGVRSLLDGHAACVDQAQPLGTGDAVRSVPESLRRSGPVLVMSADVPLVRLETLRVLLETHAGGDAACTLLTVIPDDPAGMGRVLREVDGHVGRIVEARDLPDGVAAAPECNAGVYVFDGDKLWTALDRLSTGNAQQEYYLTDVIELIDGRVAGVAAGDPSEALGINDRRQLAAAEAVVRRRVLDALMIGGVTIDDPDSTYIDMSVRIGQDSVIHPMTTIRGDTRCGAGCEIGPQATVSGVRAGDRVAIGAATVDDSDLGDDVRIGPYCRVRPNTVLASGVELGTHAEVKNSTVGSGTRINHFCCVLDTDVGKDVNIGAGTVTCNFDGTSKHRTVIGDGVFVGSNTTLVAPLKIGEHAYIGAGSVVTTDVPPGALGVGRARQRNVEGWAARRRNAPR